jgi:phospholipid-binding lipoprotein MlaA
MAVLSDALLLACNWREAGARLRGAGRIGRQESQRKRADGPGKRSLGAMVADARRSAGDRDGVDMSKLASGYLGRTVMAAATAAFLLGGCASSGSQTVNGTQDEGIFGPDNDPLEFVNRFTFAFNDMVDTLVLQPAAATYRFIVPDVVQDSIRNALRNLNGPVILANDLLQGEFERAGDTFMRFLINSTIGLAGIFDVASEWGYEYHDEDFGQTLASWGVGEGFYLVLPLLGPSNLRDTAGMVVDSYMDPWPYLIDYLDLVDDSTNDWISIGRRGLEGLDTRARNIEVIENIKKDAVDYYARIRTLYRQNREDAIRNGELEEIPIPGLSEEDWNNPPSTGDASQQSNVTTQSE